MSKKTEQSSSQEKLNKVLDSIKKTALAYDVHPSQVTLSQIIKTCSDLTEWDIRGLGGLSNIKKSHFPMTDKDLAVIREQSETSKYVRELEKKLGDKQLLKDQVLKGIENAIKSSKVNKIKVAKPPKASKSKKRMTMELMLSDIHFGKKTPTFNLQVARDRCKQLVNTFMEEYERESKEFHIDKIILALIGDVIESYTMHGLESAKGCEFGNAEQIRWAIEILSEEVLEPIAKLGLPVDIPAVAGNHDRVEKEKTMSEPGKHYMSWAIYHALRMLMQAKGLKNVNFIIPEDSNCVIEVYGSNIIYEHGDNLKGTERRSLEKLLGDRSKQYDKVLHMMRSGHWHEYLCLGRGKFIINESLCGQDGYAKTMGFDSHSGQTINFYVETKSRPNCFYKSFPVYLK